MKNKKELKKTCFHKNLVPVFDKYLNCNEYLFICNDCGMHFIVDNLNFKFDETSHKQLRSIKHVKKNNV